MLLHNRKNLFSLLVAFACLVFAMPRSARFNEDYHKGSPWRHETLVAAFDFPILRTNDRLVTDNASRASVVPYYKYSEDIAAENIRKTSALPVNKALRAQIGQSLQDIYSVGILPSDAVLSEEELQINPDVAYIQRGKSAVKVAVSNLYTLEQANDKLIKDCSAIAESATDSVFREFKIKDLLAANLVFDRTTSLLASEENRYDYSETDGYVGAGTVIVKENELVTSEIFQIIESYKKEYNNTMGYNGSEWMYWMGNIIISLAIVLILALLLFFTNTGIFNKMGSLNYVITIFLMTSVSGILASSSHSELIFAAPFTLSALYLQAFYPNKLIIPVYIISLIPLLLFSEFGVVLFVMFILAGIVAVFMFRWFGRGWKQFLTALVIFIVLSLVYLGFYLAGRCSQNFSTVELYLFVGSLLTVAGYPLIYLFERIFNLVSVSRLEELCDNSNSLLRDLEQKAPGTFQHSLQVMNMCSAVARSIGANEALIRAGAMYHDIGKMQNPFCFVENESMTASTESIRYHSELSPLQSAQDIIHHVSDGLELARKHHLPSVIEDFILTHHGTSLASFFFQKHLQEQGDPSLEPEFRYGGPKPVTKEQVILMLCDSAEAAARTLQNHSPETCRHFVESLVEEKMSNGQLADTDITIKELGIVKEAITNYLVQIYHERIAYPKRNNKQQK